MAFFISNFGGWESVNRGCKALNERGEPCCQVPHADTGLCFWHDPATEREAADARRLGGANHNKEKALQGIYGVEGLGTPEEILRVFEVALIGELALENSHNKSCVLVQIATAASRHLEVTDLNKRIEALEKTLEPRKQQAQNQKKRNWWQR